MKFYLPREYYKLKLKIKKLEKDLILNFEADASLTQQVANVLAGDIDGTVVEESNIDQLFND